MDKIYKKVLTMYFIRSLIKVSKGYDEMKFTLKQARMYSDYSQREMAKRLHVGLNTYRNYETGESPMRVDTAQEFSLITGVPFNQIIFYPRATDKV